MGLYRASVPVQGCTLTFTSAVRNSLKAVSHYRLNTGRSSVVDKTIHQSSPISFQIKPASQTIHSQSPKTPSSIVITNSATDNSRIHIYSCTGKPHPSIDQQSTSNNSIAKVYSASIHTKGMRATS